MASNIRYLFRPKSASRRLVQARDVHDILSLCLGKVGVLGGRDLDDGVDHTPGLLEARGSGFEKDLVGDLARARE